MSEDAQLEPVKRSSSDPVDDLTRMEAAKLASHGPSGSGSLYARAAVCAALLRNQILTEHPGCAVVVRFANWFVTPPAALAEAWVAEVERALTLESQATRSRGWARKIEIAEQEKQALDEAGMPEPPDGYAFNRQSIPDMRRYAAHEARVARRLRREAPVPGRSERVSRGSARSPRSRQRSRAPAAACSPGRPRPADDDPDLPRALAAGSSTALPPGEVSR